MGVAARDASANGPAASAAAASAAPSAAARSAAASAAARASRLTARATWPLVGTLLVALIAPVLPAAAAEPDYPSHDSRYHTNAEMVAEIHAAEVADPGLVDVMSIGKSERGRDIWVAKVSDNVAVDEAEPEVLVDALHHARERLTLEQALYLLATLTRDYASDPAVRAVVDSRETWIIFSVNPDGHVYDLGGNPYRLWRKNRQATPGSRFVGTDLNRNYDYRWGCCDGSSSNPAAWNYRGPAPFSAPETR
ncbi:MAG TPA: M14 family zinc carboxypeptidase, partial [Patescibacteria group bacterium]|nr:M14 family zinc carboxypeptidase [Patescibacteria group bacterium]